MTAVLVDRRPASLYFFRNYELPEDSAPSKTAFAAPPKPFGEFLLSAILLRKSICGGSNGS